MRILLVTARDDFTPSRAMLSVFTSFVDSVTLSAVDQSDCWAADAVLVDARADLPLARHVCQQLNTWVPTAAVLAVVSAEDCIAVDVDWLIDDVLLATAGIAETHARLRLAVARRSGTEGVALRFGDLVIHPDRYTASLANRELDLTLTEFKLLNYLVTHAGRAFTRTRLLHEVWGQDRNRRTVDVHIQRLRAKLGAEHESMVDTVRGVGYMALETAPSPRPPDWADAS